jgi:hypothetical protein
VVKGITYILINDSNVQALVERNYANTKYKAYPNVCPEPEKFPYAVVKLSGKSPEQCKGMDPNTYNYSYDIFSYEKSYDRCEDLDRAVVAALSKPNGGTYNGVVFQDIRHINTVDQYVNDYQLHVKVSTFEAMVNEDQAT